MDINNMQSVFDNTLEEEKAFDTIFGGEEDDELIAIVLGEEATDYDLDMNTIENDETAADLKKDLDEGEEIEAPKVDSSETVELDKDSEKETPGEAIACPQAGVADAVEKKEPEEEKLEDEIDKSIDKSDIEESFLNSILGEDTDINYNTASDSDDEAKDATDEKCHKEGDGCEDGECDDAPGSEIAPDEEVPVVYDGEETSAENLDDTFSDEGEDDDDDDDIEDENCKKEEAEKFEEPKEPQSDELTQNDNDELGLENPDVKEPEVGLESGDLDNLFKEAEDATEKAEKEEDAIIAAAEDDSEMTDDEVDALIGEDEEDELLDAVLGQ